MVLGRTLDLHGNKILQRNFQPGFRTTLHRKDMAIVLNTAQEAGLALPVSAAVAELMNALVRNGGGELDHSVLVTVFEKLGNVEVTAPSS
jgi:2-hydroxy-3-oxopropionate reductase